MAGQSVVGRQKILAEHTVIADTTASIKLESLRVRRIGAVAADIEVCKEHSQNCSDCNRKVLDNNIIQL